MKQTGKAYLLSTKHWDGSSMYLLLDADLTNATYWTSNLYELENSFPDKPQDNLEQDIHQLLANISHLNLVCEVDLPFRLDDYPELLI